MTVADSLASANVPLVNSDASVVEPPDCGVAHVPSPRKNVVLEAVPLPRRWTETVPETMAEPSCEWADGGKVAGLSVRSFQEDTPPLPV